MKKECMRCGRPMPPWDSAEVDAWNADVKRGKVTGYICPACQTPEENAEAEVNSATIVYGVDQFGRLTGRSKTSEETTRYGCDYCGQDVRGKYGPQEEHLVGCPAKG